jgi:hypothetical protein
MPPRVVAKDLDQPQGRLRRLALALFPALDGLGRDVEQPGEEAWDIPLVRRTFVNSAAPTSGGGSGSSRVVVFKAISPLAWRIPSSRSAFNRSNSGLRLFGDSMTSPSPVDAAGGRADPRPPEVKTGRCRIEAARASRAHWSRVTRQLPQVAFSEG